MGRPKNLQPKLFKRGARGSYCFRRSVNGKDKEINTGCTDLRQAESYRRRYIEAEIAAGAEFRRNNNAARAATTVIQTIVGGEWRRPTLEDGYRIYVDHTPDYDDLSPTSTLRTDTPAKYISIRASSTELCLV